MLKGAHRIQCRIRFFEGACSIGDRTASVKKIPRLFESRFQVRDQRPFNRDLRAFLGYRLKRMGKMRF